MNSFQNNTWDSDYTLVTLSYSNLIIKLYAIHSEICHTLFTHQPRKKYKKYTYLLNILATHTVKVRYNFTPESSHSQHSV